MKKIISGSVCAWMLIAASLSGAEACDGSGVCELPAVVSSVQGRMGVLSPTGNSAVAYIKQAPRLTTLKGKNIAVVGGSFMASVTHPEIKRLILHHYPDAKVYLLGEIGSAGPWPGPGVIRREKDDFVRKLKELKIDAVISGNGGCGLCTPKEMGSCIAAEYEGIPAVMIAAPGFSEQARSAARSAGVAVPRIAEYPGAFSAHTREELIANTRKIIWPQILTALTKELSAGEVEKSKPAKENAGVVFTGTFDEINACFQQNAWSDGLPIVPPTPEKVNEFLKFSAFAPDEIVAVIPPAYRKISARLVAVNAVMSGCPPEYMPILLAFTQAMADGDFRRTLASTHAWTPYCWLNGPLARQLKLDCGQGGISDSRNAKIGRFINLAMLNFGGYYIKTNRMGTFGYLMPWCLVEDDRAAVALHWHPYHMLQGFALNDNVLTASSALNWGNNLAPATADPQKIMELMAQDAVEKQQFALGSGTPFVYRTMLITGNVARDLAKKYSGKIALENALIATARQPLEARAYANYWANPGSAFNVETYPLRRHISRLGRSENSRKTLVPPWLSWIKQPEVETVPVMFPGKTAIIITGDANRNKTMCLPGGGAVSIKIKLPPEWDKLMAEAGYEPLSSFFLKSDLAPAATPRQYKNYRRKNSSGNLPQPRQKR